MRAGIELKIGVWSMKQIILASKSPRRHELLKQIGIKHQLADSHFDESSVEMDSPEKTAAVLAVNKARKIARLNPDDLVIGADTLVIFQDKILGKPRDYEEAYHMLSNLSGQTHCVITGLALVSINPPKELNC